MSAPVTGLYAAFLIAVAFALTWRVITGRGHAKVSVGDGDDETLLRLIRAHANFVETAPFVLIGMLLIELNGGPAWWLHVLGAAFVIARIGHAIGMAYKYPNIPFRLVSTATTGVIFALLVLTLLGQTFVG